MDDGPRVMIEGFRVQLKPASRLHRQCSVTWGISELSGLASGLWLEMTHCSQLNWNTRKYSDELLGLLNFQDMTKLGLVPGLSITCSIRGSYSSWESFRE